MNHINEIFYFVDNGHITGININIPLLSNFYITTIKESLLRDVHQGIFRLRLVGLCQKITIISDFNNINNKCEIINSWLINEMNKEETNK